MVRGHGSRPKGGICSLSVKIEDCKHDGRKKTEVTKSGVHLVCVNCGLRLEKLDNVVIEKVVVPKTIEKTWRIMWMRD